MLQGVVLSDDAEPSPVPNARVIVFVGAEAPAILNTAADGRFSVTLREPVSSIRVSRSGFVPFTAGGLRPGVDVQVRLVRAGVVSGRITNERGEPLTGSKVDLRARAAAAVAGSTVSAPVSTTTDDLGEFRFYAIKPGPYTVAGQGDVVSAVLSSGERPPPPQEASVDVVAGQEAAVSLTVQGSKSSPNPILLSKVSEYVRRVEMTPSGQVTVTSVQFVTPVALTGVVLDERGRALAGAMVRLEQVEPPGSSSMSASDGQGQYLVRVTRPGSYRVAVTPAGGSSAELGQRRSMERGQPIVLREGHQTLDIVVPGTAAISGRIVDPSGQPVEGIGVHAWQAQWADGRMVVRPVGDRNRKTDDRGQYRLFGLLPGTYYLAIADDFSQPQGVASVPPSPRVFYPGVTTVAAASPLLVDAGHDISGVDLVLGTSTGARLTGTVRVSTGEAAKGVVQLFADSRTGVPVAQPLTATLSTSGTFSFTGVAPGDYVVQIAADREWGFSDEFAVANVSVGGRDTAITIRTVPGSTLAGKVVFEGGPPPALSAVKVAPVPADHNTAPAFAANLQQIQLRSNWSFEINNLFGPTRIAASAPAGWWLKSVTVDGTNIADEPATFGTAERTRTDAEVVFVRGTAELTGTVSDRNRAVTDYSVVLFAVDSALHYPRSRHMTLARAGRDGRFSVTNVPPGRYFAVAVDAVTGDERDGEWQSPELLNFLATSARQVTLDAERSTTIDLPLTRIPR